MTAVNTTVEARCLCAAVRIRLRGPARNSGHCHCDNCRLSHGAGSWSWASDAVDVYRGAEQLRRYTCDVGSSRSFCRLCGSTMLYESPRWPGVVDVSRACLPEDVEPQPQKHVFADRAPTWAPILDGLPRFGGDDGCTALGGG